MIKFQTIFIPHLKYKIKVKLIPIPNKRPAGMESVGAYTTFYDDQNCTIFLPARSPVRVIAHEIVHVLREMCIDRNMDFIKESEHMAYIMQYILGKILGEIDY